MEEGPSRKLAVLLHADVVGSTKFVRMNETLAHDRMQDAFRRFFKTIDSYAGVAHHIGVQQDSELTKRSPEKE